LVEIGLKDTVAAVYGTIGPYMEDTITATDIILGPRARPDQLPLETGQKKDFFRLG
jgi:hypothetical protein